MSKRSWTVKFEPRDVWIGVYWDRRPDGLWLFVCILPMLVIIGQPRDGAR